MSSQLNISKNKNASNDKYETGTLICCIFGFKSTRNDLVQSQEKISLELKLLPENLKKTCKPVIPSDDLMSVVWNKEFTIPITCSINQVSNEIEHYDCHNLVLTNYFL